MVNDTVSLQILDSDMKRVPRRLTQKTRRRGDAPMIQSRMNLLIVSISGLAGGRFFRSGLIYLGARLGYQAELIYAWLPH